MARKCSLGFKPTADHKYMGHFMQEKFLREGHNTVPKRRTATGLGADGTTVTVQHRNKNGTTVAKTRAIADLSKKTVRRTLKAGGPAAAAIANQRPKLFKRIARRNPGLAAKIG